MTEENKQTEQKEEAKKPQDHSGVMMEGHIKIWVVDGVFLNSLCIEKKYRKT